MPCYEGTTVQGEVPMTVQCESAAPPPSWRPEVRRDPAFILAINTFAEGSRQSWRAQGVQV